MYRTGEILAPSHPSSSPSRAIGRPVPVGPIIDIYPNFDRPKPRTVPRRTGKPARPFPKLLLSAALLAVIAVTAAITFRGRIVEAIPVLGDAYAAVGLPAGETSLRLNNVRVIGVYGRDEISLSIQGEIANSAGRQLEVPAIDLTIRSIDNRILLARTIDPARAILDPGGSIRFATEIVNPPEGAHHISVRIGNGPAETFDFM